MGLSSAFALTSRRVGAWLWTFCTACHVDTVQYPDACIGLVLAKDLLKQGLCVSTDTSSETNLPELEA